MSTTENIERVERARAALKEYVDDEWDTPTVIVDILADLRHLCDADGLDFAELDRRAYTHYREEK